MKNDRGKGTYLYPEGSEEGSEQLTVRYTSDGKNVFDLYPGYYATKEEFIVAMLHSFLIIAKNECGIPGSILDPDPELTSQREFSFVSINDRDVSWQTDVVLWPNMDIPLKLGFYHEGYTYRDPNGDRYLIQCAGSHLHGQYYYVVYRVTGSDDKKYIIDFKVVLH